MSGDYVLQVDELSVCYGRQKVLSQLTLRVARGEIVAIVGRSGTGKTTFLRATAGLEPSCGGALTLRGGVAMLFQEPVLQPWLTVRENIELPGRLGNYSVDADQFLGEVGLAGYGDARVHQLSGGMKRRVELARALAQHASLVLLDEPYASLDELTAEEMYQQLLATRDQRNVAIIVVTHNVSEALYIADRVLVLAGKPAMLTAEFALPRKQRRQRSFWTLSPDTAAIAAKLREAICGAEVLP